MTSAINPIAAAYYRRIKRGSIAIGDVPASIREEVQALLDADKKNE